MPANHRCPSCHPAEFQFGSPSSSTPRTLPTILEQHASSSSATNMDSQLSCTCVNRGVQPSLLDVLDLDRESQVNVPSLADLISNPSLPSILPSLTHPRSIAQQKLLAYQTRYHTNRPPPRTFPPVRSLTSLSSPHDFSFRNHRLATFQNHRSPTSGIHRSSHNTFNARDRRRKMLEEDPEGYRQFLKSRGEDVTALRERIGERREREMMRKFEEMRVGGEGKSGGRKVRFEEGEGGDVVMG